LEQWDLMLHGQEHVSYVDADNPIPVLFGDITSRCRGLLGPGVVEGHVQAPER